jgi:hypothetical protein
MAFGKRTRGVSEDYEGNKFITGSGVYDVTIKNLILNENPDTGSATVDLFVDYNGQEQIIYGDIRVYNGNGADNAIGQAVINDLMVIADIEELGDLVEEDLPIGKEGAMETVSVYDEARDLDVTMKIVLTYDKYNSNYKEVKAVKKFYRQSDKASAAEIDAVELEGADESTLGANYAKWLDSGENISFKNGVTTYDIEKWIKAKRPKGSAGSSAKSKTAGTKRRNSFRK